MALDELQIVTPGGWCRCRTLSVTPSDNADTLQRVDGVPIMMILANVSSGVLADTKVKFRRGLRLRSRVNHLPAALMKSRLNLALSA